jgi:hypothetical protein
LHWRFGLARRSRIVRVNVHQSKLSPLTERSGTYTYQITVSVLRKLVMSLFSTQIWSCLALITVSVLRKPFYPVYQTEGSCFGLLSSKEDSL